MTVYYEDIEVGAVLRSAEYTVEEAEMRAFAEQWDPRPFHVDPDYAARGIHGGLIASAAFTMAVYLKLDNQTRGDWASDVALGWGDVRFLTPVRAGDVLSMRTEVLEKRLSRSRPGLGIVRSAESILNQHGETAISFSAPVLIRLRNG